MKRRGVVKGDTVQIVMHNCVDYFIPVLSTWLCGAIVSLTNPNTRIQTLANQFQDTSMVFCSPELAKNVCEAIQLSGKLDILMVVMDKGQFSNAHEIIKVLVIKD